MNRPADPPHGSETAGHIEAAGAPVAGWQPVRHVAPTLRIGELISLLGALVLLVSMAALRWYGAAGAGGLERTGPNRTLSAWEAMTVARWPIAGTVVVTLAAGGWGALHRGRDWGPRVAAGVAFAGAVSALVLAYRVLISPPAPERVFDVKLGAALGLGGALAIALGGWESWRGARSGFAEGKGLHDAARQSRLTPAR